MNLEEQAGMMKINSSLSKEKRILKAAEKVFSHKGYSQATLDEIIRSQIRARGRSTNITRTRKISSIPWWKPRIGNW